MAKTKVIIEFVLTLSLKTHHPTTEVQGRTVASPITSVVTLRPMINHPGGVLCHPT